MGPTCICNKGPDGDGPDIECPEHGIDAGDPLRQHLNDLHDSHVGPHGDKDGLAYAALRSVLDLTDTWEKWYLANCENPEVTSTGTVAARVEELRVAIALRLGMEDPNAHSFRWI